MSDSTQSDRPKSDIEEFERELAGLRNWGKWGADDVLVAQALPITGGTGSPLNPLAIK